MREHDLSFAGHLRAVLILGLPLVGGHLAQFAIGLTDTLMLGWYGVQELAALTLASSAFFTFFLMGAGFAWAVMPMVASFAAQGDTVMARRATRMGLWLSIGFFVLSVPPLWFSRPILTALGQEPLTAQMAQDYLRIALWGMLPALGMMTLKSFLAALERTQVILWMTVLAALANAALNWVLIFGNLGAPEMGLRGAAIASVATQLVMLGAGLAYTRAVLPEYQLFVRFWRPDAEMLGRVFRLGWPIGLTSLSEVGLFVTSALMMGWIGTVPLAAHGIVIQIATATFMVHMGLSNAVTVRAGHALGRSDVPHLRRGAVAGYALSGGMSCLTIALFLTQAPLLVGLFLAPDDPDRAAILAIGTGLLAMAALFQLVDGAQVIALGLLRGVQDTRVPMWLAAFAYWGVGLPASYAFGFGLGGQGIGIWAGLVLGLATAAVLLSLRFWRHSVPGLERATEAP